MAQEHQNQFQHFYEKWLSISIQTNLEQHTGVILIGYLKDCTVKLIGYLKDCTGHWHWLLITYVVFTKSHLHE